MLVPGYRQQQSCSARVGSVRIGLFRVLKDAYDDDAFIHGAGRVAVPTPTDMRRYLLHSLIIINQVSGQDSIVAEYEDKRECWSSIRERYAS